MTAVLVYLLVGCWCALALSCYGRSKGRGALPALACIGTILLWFCLVLLALFDLFGQALMGDTSHEVTFD